MHSKRERVTVVMDSGGYISRAGSNKEFFTKDFGGCTAICAQTDSGMYGLYHLRSTLDTEPHMVPEAADSNEPFRKWIQDLKEEANGETIHFKIGTPRNYSNNSFTERHPELGMERYIRKLCALYGIENYDITMMNMVGVDSVAITEEGMSCFYHQKMVEISLAEYQTDEEIFEHSGLTNIQCLNNIRSFPNIDYDGKLFAKYKERCDREMVQAIKQPMLITLDNMVREYQIKFDQEPKENKKAFLELHFLKKLLEAVQPGDLSSLQEMKKLPFFKQVTEDDSVFSFFTKEKSEIGKLFYKAEKLLINIQELYPNIQELPSEESIQAGSKAEL
ncbi:hypothetical protein [Legionella tucsonensis]|uniref:Uncharacterized protein n=1 Tax=Legionella tucsonensis TaxID=40335 RepID=A0A0W0ZPI0_9GAMM|nr:hypothetical protein [Legionella tucsonensis]KTD70800.1 hypothetical protein Ltuc_2811 [Legionella tucsonensis]